MKEKRKLKSMKICLFNGWLTGYIDDIVWTLGEESNEKGKAFIWTLENINQKHFFLSQNPIDAITLYEQKVYFFFVPLAFAMCSRNSIRNERMWVEFRPSQKKSIMKSVSIYIRFLMTLPNWLQQIFDIDTFHV